MGILLVIISELSRSRSNWLILSGLIRIENAYAVDTWLGWSWYAQRASIEKCRVLSSYLPTSLFPPMKPHHGWYVSLLTSLLRAPYKSGNLVIVKPKKWFKHPFWAPTPISLVLWLGGWAFIFWSNLINFGSSGSKVVWLIAKYDSNYRGTREISDLPEISSVCTSQSRGALCA